MLHSCLHVSVVTRVWRSHRKLSAEHKMYEHKPCAQELEPNQRGLDASQALED